MSFTVCHPIVSPVCHSGPGTRGGAIGTVTVEPSVACKTPSVHVRGTLFAVAQPLISSGTAADGCDCE